MIIGQNIKTELKVALDYGGSEGESFTSRIGTHKKYVYDISDVKTKQGVEKVKSYEELLYDVGDEETYYYVEVPSENPFESDKFSILDNIGLLLNPYYSKVRLVKTYLQKKSAIYADVGACEFLDS